MKQVAEGQVQQHFFPHRNKSIAATDFVDAIGGTLVCEPDTLEYIHQREHAAGHGPIGHRTHLVAQVQGQFRAEARGSQHVFQSLIATIQHRHNMNGAPKCSPGRFGRHRSLY